MSVRTIRRFWFLGLWLLAPWPFVVFGGVSVPAVRYVILASAASAIALLEGAAGPVVGMVVLFGGWAIGTTLLCWLFAWLVAKLLGKVPERIAAYVTLAIFILSLLLALFFEPYETRFGHSATGGLLDILS